jgi:hypothetical protein
VKASDVNNQGAVKGESGKGTTHHSSKIGTWISVGVVGAVILATYLVLFGLYMARV